MTENEIAKQILDAVFVVHTKLGPGLFESVYEVVMQYELKKRGLMGERQKPMPIIYDNIRFDEAFRSDMVVNGKVITELKSVEALLPVHAKMALSESLMVVWMMKILRRFLCDRCGRCARNLRR